MGHSDGGTPNFEEAYGYDDSVGMHGAAIYEAAGMHAAGVIDIEEVQSVAHNCFGSTGTCGAMFTASTMAASFEAMGIAVLGSSSHPAVLPEDRLANTVLSGASTIQQGSISALSSVKTQDYEQAVDVLFGMMRIGYIADP